VSFAGAAAARQEFDGAGEQMLAPLCYLMCVQESACGGLGHGGLALQRREADLGLEGW